MLLDRVEDSETGRVLIPEMHVDISDKIHAEATALGEILGDELWKSLPVVDSLEPQTRGADQILLDINWRPALAIIGADGMPPVQTAGNVLRTHTDLKLSFRIPPGVKAEEVQKIAKSTLEANPPYGAEVTYHATEPADGFHAPPLHEGVAAALDGASRYLTGFPPMATWIGGTIPFMAMIQKKFPEASFICTGSAGPGNNAHGPDEKLHIPHSKRVNVALAAAVAALCE